MAENTDRNKSLQYSKNDVLSVSGEYGIVNQIALQGRSFAGVSVADYHVVETNDVVYTKSPLKANPYGIIKHNSGVPGIVSTLYAVYHPKSCAISQFIDYYFQNDLRLNKYLKPLVNIGAKHDMKINNEVALTGDVIFPSVDEQAKIVDFLKLIDEKIAKQKQLVEALKSYKRGVTKAIFNPNSVYQNCAESWRLRKVSELLSYEQPQKYIVQTEHYSSNYATPVLTANKGFILGYTNETTGVYDKGDVVIYDDFTMDMKYVDFPFKVKSSTIKFLTAKPGNNLYFLFCLLQSLSLTPEGRQRSYISKVEQMNVFVPSVDEQSRIAGILKKVTVILERHEFALHKLEMLKAGLLNQLFI